MLRSVLLTLWLVTVRGQVVDQSILDEIFGTPPPDTATSGPTTQRLEDITIQPTTSQTVFTDKNGEECQCVPYYLCDNDRNGVHVNNASVTGWGELDIRFGETHSCQESVELCCKTPLAPAPTSNPSPNPIHPTEPTPFTPETTPTPSPVVRGCGYGNKGGLDFTITGGSGAEAGFGEYPWVVALLEEDNTYIGVGVLIHPSVAMTGAHVAARSSAGKMKVRAGEWDTQTSKERLPYQERVVQEIVTHEEYRPKSLHNDIALLRLESPVTLAQHINVICMPNQGEDFDGKKNCVANGWGKSAFGVQGRYAVILKRVQVNMVPHWLCGVLFQKTRLGSRFLLHQSFVCAGGEVGKDTCEGDGGAPLACPIEDNRYKLTGLVAWGIGCGQRNVPGAYTKVAHFIDWTNDKMAAWNLRLVTLD